MTATNPNDPAFPNKDHMGDGPDGLTKRELFAAMAMQGDIANGDVIPEGSRAVYWLRCADALIAELSKDK